MGVYFIAAGSSTKNREKTLERPHTVGELAECVPSYIASRLQQSYADGESVFAWGATDARANTLAKVRPGEFVVDVDGPVVRQVFTFEFQFTTDDLRLQNYLGWDRERPLPEHRRYRHVYFLSSPQPTERTQKSWFQHAFGFTNPHWLTGQRYFSDQMIREAMRRTQSPTVEAFLGIATPKPVAKAQPAEGVREPEGDLLVRPGSGARPYVDTEPDPAATPETARSGQGRGLSTPERRAVEHHAMARARDHFEMRWDSVTDVSGSESYDLLCRRGNAELRVEVKGTTGGGDSVLLTRNEVQHARQHYPHVALFIVHGIQLTGRGTEAPSASGGHVRLFNPWDLDDGFVLTAETYRCQLPAQ